MLMKVTDANLLTVYDPRGVVESANTPIATRPKSVKGSFSKDAEPEIIAEIAANNDLVLTAIGDCGSCCSCCIRDSVALERLGLPSAAIITTEFEKETVLTRTAIGMEGLIPVVIDHPVSSITQTEVESRAARVAEMAPKVWLGR